MLRKALLTIAAIAFAAGTVLLVSGCSGDDHHHHDADQGEHPSGAEHPSGGEHPSGAEHPG